MLCRPRSLLSLSLSPDCSLQGCAAGARHGAALCCGRAGARRISLLALRYSFASSLSTIIAVRFTNKTRPTARLGLSNSYEDETTSVERHLY